MDLPFLKQACSLTADLHGSYADAVNDMTSDPGKGMIMSL